MEKKSNYTIICSDEYKEILINNSSIKSFNFDKEYLNFYIMHEKNETVKEAREEEIRYYDTILERIENAFTDKIMIPKN